MSFILQPWQLFFMVLASWVHHEQQKIIEFYQAELKAVGNVLKQHGIEPAPDRKRQTTWATFIKSQWDLLGADESVKEVICEASPAPRFDGPE